VSQGNRVEAAKGAAVLVQDHFRVQPGESVVITADTASDGAAVDAIMSAVAVAGARPVAVTVPQLPFQGALADPHIADPVAEAVIHSDVWFDLTFPYMAGSGVHDRALHAKRTRYLLLGDMTAGGLYRLFGKVELDRLFELQEGFDRFMASKEGSTGRITSPAGTDVTFRIAKPATRKLRVVRETGTFTPLGAGIFFPDPDSVRGEIVIDAMFHEHYAVLPEPVRLVIDGRIREVRGGGVYNRTADRALRRASRGNYGRVIHLTVGLHPAAQFTGRSFIEDIRSVGTNAIGLGEPWWEPGGGENHPDAVLGTQSLWVDGEQIVRDGVLVHPPELARIAHALHLRPFE
jgi:leucyl aminopeptidase (aminopeptidase T)